MWLKRYHRDPHVLGGSLLLDRKPYSIIGVMPRSFQFPLEDSQLNQAELWVPMSLTPEELSENHAGFWGYQMVARIKDGVALRKQPRMPTGSPSRSYGVYLPRSLRSLSKVTSCRCSSMQSEKCVHCCGRCFRGRSRLADCLR